MIRLETIHTAEELKKAEEAFRDEICHLEVDENGRPFAPCDTCPVNEANPSFEHCVLAWLAEEVKED